MATWPRQNRRHIDEKALFVQFPSVPRPPSLRQPLFSPPRSSAEHSAVVSNQGEKSEPDELMIGAP